MTLGLLFTIGHLFGVAFGAGGAYLSDVMFFYSVKNGYLSRSEIRFLSLASKMVWFGLLILIISGIGLFTLDPERYLASTKFLSKMSIVGIIFLNGLIFEFIHFGHLRLHLGRQFKSFEHLMKRLPFLMVSGVVSITSWTFALVLGSLKSVPYSYLTIMSFYLIVITVAIGILFYVIHNHKFIGRRK